MTRTPAEFTQYLVTLDNKVLHAGNHLVDKEDLRMQEETLQWFLKMDFTDEMLFDFLEVLNKHHVVEHHFDTLTLKRWHSVKKAINWILDGR